MTEAIPIATRILTLRRDGQEAQVPIRIFAPQQDSVGHWGCRFEIGWPDNPVTMTAGGIDAVQTLDIALRLIGTRLYTSPYHRAGELISHFAGGGYGFPVPENMRDMLVGDDAKFF